jgi:hypothetical protein
MCEEGYLLDGNSSPPITTNIPRRIGEGSTCFRHSDSFCFHHVLRDDCDG